MTINICTHCGATIEPGDAWPNGRRGRLCGECWELVAWRSGSYELPINYPDNETLFAHVADANVCEEEEP